MKDKRFEANPAVMGGKLCIRGTRIPVDLIRQRLLEGASEKAILESYQNLTSDDIQAVREALARPETTT